MRKYTRFLTAIVASVVLASGPIMAQKSGSSKSSPSSTPAAKPSSPSAPRSSGFSGSGGSRTPSAPAQSPTQRPSQTSPTQRPSPGFSGSGAQRTQEPAKPQTQQSSQPKAPSGFSGSGGARSPIAVPGKAVSTPTKPNFDSAAGRAQSQQRSTQAYSDWKKASGLDSKPFNPDLQKTRVQREETYYRNRQPTGYYRPPSTNVIVVYRDHYNDNFLMYMTPLWFYHHWNMIDRSRFQDQQIRDLESRMREYERQGLVRNPNYVEAGTDSDLMYQQNVAYEATLIPQNQQSQGMGRFGKLMLATFFAVVVGWFIWFVRFRRIP